jgi:AcrR family transcriptional regulator
MTEKRKPRRERRIAARKRQILQAAAQVFAEKGFNGATTREIADIADVAEGTIYNYFDSKEDLLSEMVHDLSQPDTWETWVEVASARLPGVLHQATVRRFELA